MNKVVLFGRSIIGEKPFLSTFDFDFDLGPNPFYLFIIFKLLSFLIQSILLDKEISSFASLRWGPINFFETLASSSNPFLLMTPL